MKLTFDKNIYKMKRIILSLAIVLAGLNAVNAQTNIPTDAAKPQVAEVKKVNPNAAEITFKSLALTRNTNDRLKNNELTKKFNFQ